MRTMSPDKSPSGSRGRLISLGKNDPAVRLGGPYGVQPR
jgi:hypothetical protein